MVFGNHGPLVDASQLGDTSQSPYFLLSNRGIHCINCYDTDPTIQICFAEPHHGRLGRCGTYRSLESSTSKCTISYRSIHYLASITKTGTSLVLRTFTRERSLWGTWKLLQTAIDLNSSHQTTFSTRLTWHNYYLGKYLPSGWSQTWFTLAILHLSRHTKRIFRLVQETGSFVDTWMGAYRAI